MSDLRSAMLAAYEAFDAEHGQHEHVRFSVFSAGVQAGAQERDAARARVAVLERTTRMARTFIVAVRKVTADNDGPTGACDSVIAAIDEALASLEESAGRGDRDITPP